MRRKVYRCTQDESYSSLARDAAELYLLRNQNNEAWAFSRYLLRFFIFGSLITASLLLMLFH